MDALEVLGITIVTRWKNKLFFGFKITYILLPNKPKFWGLYRFHRTDDWFVLIEKTNKIDDFRSKKNHFIIYRNKIVPNLKQM